MPAQIWPSDSYTRFIVQPTRKLAPEHIKKLLSNYRVTHFLGAGGFADVYEGTDEDGVGVAIKVPQFKMEKTMDSTTLKRFASEADIWKKLHHENIVNIYDTDLKPMPHIVMELMEGGDLEGLMKNHQFTVEEAVHIMVQILEGISYAHRMATIHRDLKPENILFTSDGVAKITDWGIGKYMASEGITKTIETKGTLAYSAPEQFDSKKYGKIDWQTDIFQLGILFYKMLTGEKPFQGRDMAEIMGNVLTYHPIPPSEYNSDVPSELDDIVLGALEKDKDYRWESGAVMLHELKLVIKGKVHVRRKERVSRKIMREVRKRVEVLDKLERYLVLLEDEGIDVSGYKQEMKSIEKYAKLKWYDKVREHGGLLLYDLERMYKQVQKERKTPIKRLMQPVRILFEDFLSRNLEVEVIYKLNDEAMESYEEGNYNKAEKLFLDLQERLEKIIERDDRIKNLWQKAADYFEEGRERGIEVEKFYNMNDKTVEEYKRGKYDKAESLFVNLRKHLKNLIDKDKRIEAAKKEFYDLKQDYLNPFRVPPPPGLRILIEEYIDKAEEKIEEWKESIRAEDVRRQEEGKRRVYEERVQPHKIEINELNKKCSRYGLKMDLDYQRLEIKSASTLFQQGQLLAAEDKYIKIKKRLKNQIYKYEEEERRRKEYNERIINMKEEVGLLVFECKGYGLELKGIDKDLHSASELIKKGKLLEAEDEYAQIRKRIEIADQIYKDKKYKEWQTKAKEQHIRREKVRRKRKRRAVTACVIVVAILITSVIGGYVWFNWDSDGDGVRDNNDLDFEWIDILSGTFWMGSSSGDGSDDERPRHQITISEGFQILKFEVTQAQWVAVMGSDPSGFSGDRNPVESVSWNDCQSCISKLNELDSNHTYRLPTEAEWEYACRAGSTTAYSYGNDSGQLGQYAWYDDNSNSKTHPVGEKEPNAWGLYDMHGNVWEWCQDWYDSDYYNDSPGTDPQGPNSGSYRVLRGGGWSSSADGCRSAIRNRNTPDNVPIYFGLRLVRFQASR